VQIWNTGKVSGLRQRLVAARAVRGGRAGDTVTSAPGEWHWHGAAPGTFIVHLAVSDGTTEWAEHVTDDEYQG
jgi:hypothetical protein